MQAEPVERATVSLPMTGCAWAGDTSALSSGPIQIEAANTTQSYAGFALYLVVPGHTYQELATIIEGYDTQARQDPQNVQISVPSSIATGHGVIGTLGPGATTSLASDIPSGSVAGIACWRASRAGGVTRPRTPSTTSTRSGRSSSGSHHSQNQRRPAACESPAGTHPSGRGDQPRRPNMRSCLHAVGGRTGVQWLQ